MKLFQKENEYLCPLLLFQVRRPQITSIQTMYNTRKIVKIRSI